MRRVVDINGLPAVRRRRLHAPRDCLRKQSDLNGACDAAEAVAPPQTRNQAAELGRKLAKAQAQLAKTNKEPADWMPKLERNGASVRVKSRVDRVRARNVHSCDPVAHRGPLPNTREQGRIAGTRRVRIQRESELPYFRSNSNKRNQGEAL